MFRESLEALLDPRHELLRLAARIDWDRLDALYGATFVERVGRPGLPTRLMLGLHLLKHIKGLSDEAVCAAWVENPYFQAFCGETHFQHKLPADRSSMTNWRKRMDPERLEALLAETIAIAMQSGAVSSRQLERITLDTTVQTKAVAHPTDSHLMLRAIEWLNRAARTNGVPLRQSYLRVARRARKEAARLMHGRGHKQAKAHLRFMRTRLGRLIRDIERKIEGDPARIKALATVLERARTIHGQEPGDTRKLYAFHAPEVECIGKGKARTRYEFGVKASFATTNERCKGGQFVLGAMALPGNPYDGHTLGAQLDQVTRITGTQPSRAYLDRGYRGHGLDRDGLDVHVSYTRGITSPTIKRELGRRNAIEPVIGHLKQDGLLERNPLKGTQGDAINAMLCAVGHNLRLLLAWFRTLLWLIVAAIICKPETPSMGTAAQN
jgi:IS5 family transposase